MRTNFHPSEVRASLTSVVKEDGSLVVGAADLLMMAGHKMPMYPSGHPDYIQFLQQEGLVFKTRMDEVELALHTREVNREAARLLKEAKDALDKVMPSHRRTLKLDPFTTVNVSNLLSRVEPRNIFHVKVGDSADVLWTGYYHDREMIQNSDYQVFGKVKQELMIPQYTYGNLIRGHCEVTFTRPSILFTRAEPHSGYKAYKFLYIAE